MSFTFLKRGGEHNFIISSIHLNTQHTNFTNNNFIVLSRLSLAHLEWKISFSCTSLCLFSFCTSQEQKRSVQFAVHRVWQVFEGKAKMISYAPVLPRAPILCQPQVVVSYVLPSHRRTEHTCSLQWFYFLNILGQLWFTHAWCLCLGKWPQAWWHTSAHQPCLFTPDKQGTKPEVRNIWSPGSTLFR